MLNLLIELGADLEARDMRGHSALETAMLLGDREAAARLKAAGAALPTVVDPPAARDTLVALSRSVKKGVPMLNVPDVARALAWYADIGFREVTRFEGDGVVNFGMVAFGDAELMFNAYGSSDAGGVSLWFYTDDIDRLYDVFKARQLAAAQAELSGASAPRDAFRFEQDIEDMFYGARQFCIRDLNGYRLYFIQESGQ